MAAELSPVLASVAAPVDGLRRALIGAPFFALGGTAAAAPGEAAGAAATPAALEPLGIGLEGLPYPAPVEFLPLVMDGQRVRMAYMDFAPSGGGNGRAILLLHGKNFDSSYWSGPIAWLAQAGFRVVVPDQVGFNKSSKPDLAYTFEALAANTIALLDKLGIERAAALGHSTGGMLAVRLASIYPQRLTHLILEDPIGLVDYRDYVAPQSTETLTQAELRYTAESYRAFVSHYFPRLPPAEYEPFVTWRMRVALSGEYDRFCRASALTYQMIYRNPVRGLYRQLQPPVLLTAGETDQSAPLSGYATREARARMPSLAQAARETVREIPHGRLVTFPGVGHVPHLEAPNAFRDAVLAFLAQAG